MQSLTQALSDSTLESTVATECPTDPEASYEQEPHKMAGSEALAQDNTVITTEGSEKHVEAEETHAATTEKPADILSSENSPKKDTYSTAKPDTPTKSALDNKSKSVSDSGKDKKVARKYVMSKKAMIDPLKMDMSKPVVMPLTSDELSLHCLSCHIIFQDDKSKVRHLKLNHPMEYENKMLSNSLFTCYVCERPFANSLELRAHQKSHTEETPFKCPICDQAFKMITELTAHKKAQHVQGSYTCTHCGKICKTLTLLKYHNFTHTGEKPYECKKCGKKFNWLRAYQNHMDSHLSGRTEQDGNIRKAQLKKKDGSSTVRYPCSMCKASLKTPKSRQRHMKSKHNMLPSEANIANPARKQVRQSTAIITPISFSQPALLQVEPNGPLQKVDGNIDTEQIRRLIESMENVKKVNQVVILGQVPPNAPPLEVQRTSQFTGSPNLTLNSPSTGIIELKQTNINTLGSDISNNICDPMEQTIILEPITPDGQLINRPFSELASNLPGEPMELTLIQADQTERPVEEVMHQIEQQHQMDAIGSPTLDQMASQNEGGDLNADLEQTVILELTPVLSPTIGLEQFQTVPQNDISLTSEAKRTASEIPNKTEKDDHGTNPEVPSCMSTFELQLTSLHTEQQNVSSSSFVQQNITQHAQCPTELESNAKENTNSSTLAVDKEVQEVVLQKTQNKTECESKITALDKKKSVSKNQELSAKKKALSPKKAKQVTCPPEVPINVMSAQELVKVRKRKPARTFIFQGYMQDLLGSMYKEDLKLNSKPAKQRKTKESHLVKFGPQNKGAKNKKQKNLSQMSEPVQESVSKPKTPKSEKKVSPQKKGGKGKKNATAESVLPTEKVSPTSLVQVSSLQRMKDDSNKSKKKKQKDVAKGTKQKPTQIQKPATLPMFKNKKQTKKVQKKQANNQKVEKTKVDLAEEEKGERVDILNSHSTQDCLLLLKGHKQPQLKVYKLDPSKASGQAPDPTTHEFQTNTQSDGTQQNHSISESTAPGKKKGGRTKKNHKALSLLSSLKNSRKTPETPTTKPKTTRKRKSSSKLEIEGIITSSKRSLDCKECGEMFSDVSSLQKHKTTAHIVESPSLTYTNGNIFEGVANVNLYQLPKSPRECVGAMSTAADWDTEPEIAMEDREQNLSFPALIPSPSLTIPPAIMGSNCFDDTGGPVTDTNQQPHTSPELDLSTVKTQKRLVSVTPQLSLSSFSKTSESVKTKELLSPVDEKLEQNSPMKLTSVSEVVAAVDDDLKEELLLDVNLVTVGEKTEDEDSTCEGVSVPQNKSNTFECDSREQGPANDQPAQSLTSQTVSCSTNRVEVKEEEEESLIQRKKVRGKRAVKDKEPGGMRRGKKSLKKDVATKQALISDSDKEMNSEKEEHSECQVVFEKHPAILGSDKETEANSTTATVLPSTSSACDCSHDEEQVVFELKSVTTSVHEVRNKAGLPGGEHDGTSDQSPLVTLEKFLASRQRTSAETEPEIMTKGHHKQRSVSMEEDRDPAFQNTQGTSVATQHHQDIRTVLVKEENRIIPEDVQNTNGSKHIRWNVEPVSNEDTDIPGMESPEITRESRITPEFSSSQCIFYPVKVEEKAMQVGVTHAHRGRVNPEASPEPNQMEHQNALCHTHEGSPPALEYQHSRVQGLLSNSADSDYTNNQDFQPSPNLREFLLQSSDEEDGGALELCDPQIHSEAEIMAYFNQNQSNSSHLPDQTSPKKPMEYFSKYFGWDTWVEIAEYTNRPSSISNPVTPNEVAHFIGIHIAMGTLKFPCSKLYWEDLTKVPLIAEAMTLPRFLELSHKLKLSSPASVSSPGNANNRDFPTPVQDKASPSRYCKKPLGDQTNEMTALHSHADPLWKIQPLLRRFKSGCQSLRQEDHYAIDHYPLQLTGRMHSNQISLYCTSLIGFSGSLSCVDLTLNFADKEDAVEKMVAKGSMVFLCKQELSTPAMLERLLTAGVNGAGMVGGSRGQVGDEFVSSDGRLMLRRSHRGFILSTAGSSLKSIASLIDKFEKAQMLARLNKGLQNLYTTPFTASTPTCWPQAVLWYLTDLALVNSWLQYRQESGTKSVPLTLMAFRLEVSKALIFSGSDTQDSVPPHSPTEPVHARNETSNPVMTEGSPLPDAATRYDGYDHWPEQLGEGEGGRCRFGDCQRMSRVLCLKCCVFLCISRNHNCFLNFHSQRSLEKK